MDTREREPMGIRAGVSFLFREGFRNFEIPKFRILKFRRHAHGNLA